MTELLHVTLIPLPDKMKKENIVPLALPFSVDPESAPYLVSGSKEPTVWVPSAPKGKLHAAIRDEKNFQEEVLDAITLMSMQSDWGNVCDFSMAGVVSGIAYLAEMGFEREELELLVNPESKADFLEDMELTLVDWAPENCVVILPKDRSFLGWYAKLLPGKIVAVVHNPSRGIALARG